MRCFGDVLQYAKHRANDASNDVNRPPLGARHWGSRKPYERTSYWGWVKILWWSRPWHSYGTWEPKSRAPNYILSYEQTSLGLYHKCCQSQFHKPRYASSSRENVHWGCGVVKGKPIKIGLIKEARMTEWKTAVRLLALLSGPAPLSSPPHVLVDQ